jgi:hypothetical protein
VYVVGALEHLVSVVHQFYVLVCLLLLVCQGLFSLSLSVFSLSRCRRGMRASTLETGELVGLPKPVGGHVPLLYWQHPRCFYTGRRRHIHSSWVVHAVCLRGCVVFLVFVRLFTNTSPHILPALYQWRGPVRQPSDIGSGLPEHFVHERRVVLGSSWHPDAATGAASTGV